MDSANIDAWKAALWPVDLDRITSLLESQPELVNCQPWAPDWTGTAIEAVASGAVWHRPDNTVAAGMLLAAGATADLQTLARAGLLAAVTERLDADPALLDSRDSAGRTALYRAACVYGAFPPGEAVAEMLVARGATVDIWTASTLGMRDRVQALLADDPTQANAVDPDGMTALHWAARQRRDRAMGEPIMAALLAAGADHTACNQQEDGMMPIHHIGEWCGQPGQLDLLLAAGADINARAEKTGWTPLDYAIDRGRHEMADYMRSHGAEESGRR